MLKAEQAGKLRARDTDTQSTPSANTRPRSSEGLGPPRSLASASLLMKLISENHQEEQLREKTLTPPSPQKNPKEIRKKKTLETSLQFCEAAGGLSRSDLSPGKGVTGWSGCGGGGQPSPVRPLPSHVWEDRPSELRGTQHVNPPLVKSHPLTSPDSTLTLLYLIQNS